nr:MAG TPA: Protein of unknown function (DUF2577) [Caudoviricetes sp.]
MNGENLLGLIQQAAKKVVEASNLTDYCIGMVESTAPLVIRTEQQETLTEDFLILTDLVRDYDVDITVNHTTQNRSGGGGDSAFASHNHQYTGRKRITVHNGLSSGEAVILVRQAGGQEFIVLSRVNNHINLSGQWG